MNAEKLMNAIGNISDRHIEEFAIVTPKRQKNIWMKAVPIAACFCVLLVAIVIPNITKHEVGVHDVPDSYEIIWCDASQNENIEKYIDKFCVGEIVVTNSLKKLMDSGDSNLALYAVLITETTGKSKEYIYRTFVKTLDVREQYLEYGIIYITENQINSLVCPQDLALILSPASNPDK